MGGLYQSRGGLPTVSAGRCPRHILGVGSAPLRGGSRRGAGDESGMVRGPAATRGVSGGVAHGGRAGTPSEGSVLGRGARVRGRIGGEGDLRVEGQVEGDVVVSGELSIEEGGAITGDVGRGVRSMRRRRAQGRRGRARRGRPPRHRRRRGQPRRRRGEHRRGRVLPRPHRAEFEMPGRARAGQRRGPSPPTPRSRRGRAATILGTPRASRDERGARKRGRNHHRARDHDRGRDHLGRRGGRRRTVRGKLSADGPVDNRGRRRRRGGHRRDVALRRRAE